MARKFDLLVFDWDGTLLDSTGAIVEAVKAACRDLGQPEPDDAHARQVIGLGLLDALRHSVPELPEDRLSEMVARYRYHYLSRDHALSLFAGIRELLDELYEAGILLAVATGKSRLGLDRSMKHNDLAVYFSATRCADECFSKPHPQMLEELMAELSVVPERTLMVGDTTHDLQMAINAGVPALAVSYGAHAPQALEALSPLARMHSVDALTEWLRAHALESSSDQQENRR